MNNVFETIQSLPAEYRDKIMDHYVAGDPDQLAIALEVALKCFRDLHRNNGAGLTGPQKRLGKTLEQVRSELAIELLRLEGFDLAAAKARGKAETGKAIAGKQKEWSQSVVPALQTTE